jgi:hypothetical protein
MKTLRFILALAIVLPALSCNAQSNRKLLLMLNPIKLRLIISISTHAVSPARQLKNRQKPILKHFIPIW